MFVAQEVVPVEVTNKHFVDYSLKVFADDTEEANGPILRQMRAHRILGKRTYTPYLQYACKRFRL